MIWPWPLFSSGDIFLVQTMDIRNRLIGLIIKGTIYNKKAFLAEQSHSQDFLFDFQNVPLRIFGIMFIKEFVLISI